MKIVLAISLILNVVLGIFLTKKEEQKPVLERLIIETHEKPKEVKLNETRGHVVQDVNPAPKTKEKKKEEEIKAPEFYSFENDDFQDAGEKMEAERVEFLTTKLGLPEEKVAKHKELREQYFKDTTKFWNKSPMGEMSFKDKRRLVDLEEKLYQDLEKLYGKKNWDKYQKYREDYNQRGFKNQQEQNQPFLFMGI